MRRSPLAVTVAVAAAAVAALALTPATVTAVAATPNVLAQRALLAPIIASTPPRGFNSWDSFKGTINETAFMDVADKVVELKLAGGHAYYMTVDEFWYVNNCGDASCVDQYGRAQVDTTKWPSAADGVGFKAVADKIHNMGLQFGIHVMHGVPVALKADTAARVMGMPDVRPWSLITDDQAHCPWNPNWYKVNMSRPGAQEYFDSIYLQYAAWGVDLVKLDCHFGQNLTPTSLSNIQASRNAMDKAGRPVIFSLSPGFPPGTTPQAVLAGAKSVSAITNMYRVTSDWHGWNGTDKEQGWDLHFMTADATTPVRGAPAYDGTKSWPDLDMLNPFRDPESFRAQQTLWAIARSPLIYGGDPRDLTPTHPHVLIMTNPGINAVTDSSSNNRMLWADNTTAAWAADAPGGGTYVAAFRFADGSPPAPVTVSLEQLGIAAGATVSAADVWSGKVLGTYKFKVPSPPLAPCHSDGTDSPTACSAMLLVTAA